MDGSSQPGPDPGAPSPRRILVAYASKHGSTAEIAAAIGATLRSAGFEAEVRPAAEVRRVDGYMAVVVGSGLYSATWLRDANRFVRAHLDELRARPVWLFSSGPLDHSAGHEEIPMTRHVATATAGIGARGHRTFGGRLREDAPEVAAGILATHRTGDFRDWAAVRAWAQSIAAALG